jgi:8-oxo-dGTP pyrophosphatase MutT (NUDIX family)
VDFRTQIKEYQPWNEEEAQDKKVFIKYMEQFSDILTRRNEFAHMTSSSWILNREHTKVLMVYHNIYNSWSWTGGHADGEEDLLHVAIKEAKEETGIKTIRPLTKDIFSLELLCVQGHWKRGKYVSPHIHLNTTFLLEAEEAEEVRNKPDENRAVQWVLAEEAAAISREPWMQIIYKKLNKKLEEIAW